MLLLTMDFDTAKRTVIESLHDEHRDRSRKGSVDVQILPLVEQLCGLEHHYTTSSCAGRILVYGLAPDRKKHTTAWLLASHDAISLDQVNDALAAVDEHMIEVWLKCESPILHVCSRTMDDALWLLNHARSLGLRRSGIISAKPDHDKNMVELMGTVTFAVPLVANHKVLAVSQEYLKQVVDLANEKLLVGRQPFTTLFNSLQLLSSPQ